jgi:hypothetical protein
VPPIWSLDPSGMKTMAASTGGEEGRTGKQEGRRVDKWQRGDKMCVHDYGMDVGSARVEETEREVD